MKEIIKHKFPYLFFLLLFSRFAPAYGRERKSFPHLSKGNPINTIKKEKKKKPNSRVYTQKKPQF
ncbi:hypothetical protein NXW16_18945 [Bacteroides thetaiotaomicron]|nr:hypothetical protein [Bacteroides thetaiotaomicron]